MIDWDRIENFIGYGNPEAPIVFLGMEEGLRRDADLEADLQSRSRYDPYMDLAAAQTQLDGPGAYFGHAPITQKTWRPMCDLMLRWNGIEHPTLEQRLRYQADHLGRLSNDSLLTELLPYPHSDSGQWLYERFDRFKTREAYADAIIPRRQLVLRKIFSDREPEVIVAYGKRNWPDYQGIFPGAKWEVDGPFAFTSWGRTRVVLTHALSGRQFNTDAQLERFAEICLRRPMTTTEKTKTYFYRALKLEPYGSWQTIITGCRHEHETLADAWACSSPLEYVVEVQESADGNLEVLHVDRNATL